MSRRQSFPFMLILIIAALMPMMSALGQSPAAVTSVTPALPRVAIHVSELTQALETLPAGPNTPKPPAVPEASGFEWWPTSWHYFVMPESVKEALSSDGTPYAIVTDADISAGNLLHPDGSPRYPILISLAAEAIRDDEIAPLRSYVNAGGFLFVGSSSFTRNSNGTTRGDFALGSELGLRMRNSNLQNWYTNRVFGKALDNRIVAHIPSSTLNWHLPLTSEEIPLGTTTGHAVHQDHYAWAVDSIDAEILANGSSGPLLATKAYGSGRFIYFGIFQPLIGLGGNDAGMYSYLIFRRAIEWAFEAANLPIVKLSPWRYDYDSAFIVRHDFENNPSSIQAIESIAQSEHAKGVKGEYYFCTGVVRVGSEDTQLTNAQKQAATLSLQRAVSLYGATIGSHNGGLANPVNPALPPTTYDYWHWGPDEALDTHPSGYANGKAYAQESILRSFQDIEGWLSGLDNGRSGCGSLNNCPRVWVSPYFNSGREGSFEVMEQLGVASMGEQKLSPFPHWTLSTQTNGKRYAHLTLPVSDWYVGDEVAQSLEQHSDSSMRAGVDFYSELGLLVNFYGHGSSADYSSYVVAKPRMWSTNAIGIYDWWVLRTPVIVTPSYSQNGNVASVIATIANATDPNTAIELVIPYWGTGSVGNLEVLLNGATANPNEYRTTNTGVKIKVGSAVTTVEVRYQPVIVTPTPTPTPTPTGMITIGETSILGVADSGNANILVAQEAVLGQSGTIQSLSLYVSIPAGQLRLGIYDDAGGRPGTLRAQTDAFTPVTGWNTHNVTAPALLAPGTYWLTYLTDSSSLGLRVTANGLAWGYSYPFGAMPITPPDTALGSAEAHWSLYASLLIDTGATPTPTSPPPPIAPVLSASREGNNIRISWPQSGANSAYQVWRGTAPSFVPGAQDTFMIGDAGTANCSSGGNLTCTDEGVVGDPGVNHFYVVRAFNTAGAWVDSGRIGEFDFALQPGAP